MQRLIAATRKEFLQFYRDWMLIALIGFIYTGDVVMCTYALSFDVKNLSLAVFDGDRSELSDKLVERFTATEYFGKLFQAARLEDVDRLLDEGGADLALVIPHGFSEKVSMGRSADVQLVVSGVNSNTANAARGYANIILERFAHDQIRELMQAQGITVSVPEVVASPRIWYNPELRFRYFMVISMIVVAGLMLGVVTTSASLVREKESGTVEQLMVTPLRKHEVVLAKMMPPFAVGMVSLVPSLAIAKWFEVPMHGSLALFFIASAASLFAAMGIGILVSTFARNLQQALLISFFILFPLMFLSGTIVPVESMPLAMQYLSLLSPVRYHMEIALSILLKGVGVAILWPKLVALLAFSLVLFILSLRRLRKRMYE
jgi:ABC-2 type transport system permease protein